MPDSSGRRCTTVPEESPLHKSVFLQVSLSSPHSLVMNKKFVVSSLRKGFEIPMHFLSEVLKVGAISVVSLPLTLFLLRGGFRL